MNRKVIAFAAVACAVLVTDRKAHTAPADLAVLLTGLSSKEVCSCVFVVEQDDEYCKAFGNVGGGFDYAITIDRDKKVASCELGGVTRTAHFVENEGCTLDPSM